NPGGRVRAEARTDLSRFRLGGTMPATAIEKEAEAKTSQKVSVDGSRRDPGTASPVLDGAHAPVMEGAQPAFLDSRTLLSLQATAPGESDGELAALDTAVVAPDSAAATGPEIAEGAAAEERLPETGDAQREAGGEASAESAAGAADAPEPDQQEPTASGEAPEDASAPPEEAPAAQDQGPTPAEEAGAGDSTGLVSQDAQAELSAEQSGFPSEEFRGAGGGGGGSAIEERP